MRPAQEHVKMIATTGKLLLLACGFAIFHAAGKDGAKVSKIPFRPTPPVERNAVVRPSILNDLPANDGSLGGFHPTEDVLIHAGDPGWKGQTVIVQRDDGDAAVGGVFNFRRIAVPKVVTVRIEGYQFVILRAEGDVTIDGVIDASGQDGSPGGDGISSTPVFAGPAGGDGGDGGTGAAGAGNGGGGGEGNPSGQEGAGPPSPGHAEFCPYVSFGGGGAGNGGGNGTPGANAQEGPEGDPDPDPDPMGFSRRRAEGDECAGGPAFGDRQFGDNPEAAGGGRGGDGGNFAIQCASTDPRQDPPLWCLPGAGGGAGGAGGSFG